MGLGARFTVIDGSITAVHDRMNAHDVNHNTVAGGKVVAELSDVQKKGQQLALPALSLLVALGTAVGVIVKNVFFP